MKKLNLKINKLTKDYYRYGKIQCYVYSPSIEVMKATMKCH